MSHNGHNMKLKEILKATGAKDWKEAVTRLGYGEMFGLDDNQWFDFTIRIEKPEQIRRIISLIESYDEFEGEKIAEVLAMLVENGRVMYVEFGRAGSPELRVFMRNPEQDRENMMNLLREFKPDELDEFGPWAIRAWWD